MIPEGMLLSDVVTILSPEWNLTMANVFSCPMRSKVRLK